MNPTLNILGEAFSTPENRKHDSKWIPTSSHKEEGQEWGKLGVIT